MVYDRTIFEAPEILDMAQSEKYPKESVQIETNRHGEQSGDVIESIRNSRIDTAPDITAFEGDTLV
jgi:hypothetical protein